MRLDSNDPTMGSNLPRFSAAFTFPAGGPDTATHRGARRRYRRWPFDAEVMFVSPVKLSGLAINASEGGIRIAMGTLPPVDELSTMRIRKAPGQEAIERVRVVWSQTCIDGYLVGLEFIEQS